VGLSTRLAETGGADCSCLVEYRERIARELREKARIQKRRDATAADAG